MRSLLLKLDSRSGAQASTASIGRMLVEVFAGSPSGPRLARGDMLLSFNVASSSG
jgi:hypothetical protein